MDRNARFRPEIAAICQVAPLAGSVDRNGGTRDGLYPLTLSLPSRGAWIEIVYRVPPRASASVAPLAGSVDRNGKPVHINSGYRVAPLAGSVDRNIPICNSMLDLGRRSPRGERG